MKKAKIFLALLLVVCMICGALASCTGGTVTDETDSSADSEQTNTESNKTETSDKNESSDKTEETSDGVGPDIPSDSSQLDGIYSDAIKYANSVKNLRTSSRNFVISIASTANCI